MKYKLYTSDHCRSCAEVLSFIDDLDITVIEVNLSKPSANRPENLMIVPALFANDKLVAYGSDIPEYFLKRSA